MNLSSGRKVKHDILDITVMVMPDEVINRVNDMGKNNPEGLIFTDKDNNEIIDTEDEESIADQDDQSNEASTDSDTIASNDDDTVDSTGVDPEETDRSGRSINHKW